MTPGKTRTGAWVRATLGLVSLALLSLSISEFALLQWPYRRALGPKLDGLPEKPKKLEHRPLQPDSLSDLPVT